jgi:ABC-type glycerol-3-phosphate transport system permease component
MISRNESFGTDAPRSRKRAWISNAWPYAVVAIFFLGISLPILWVFKTSLTPQNQTVIFPPQLLPDAPTLANYSAVLSTNAPRFFLNTFIIATGSIVLTMLVGIPAAYAGSRLRFKGRESIMFAVLMVSYIPAITTLVAIYAVAIRSGLVDSYPLLIVVYSGFIVGRVVWFLQAFFENVPYELEEAAFVDGATRLRTVWHITLPLLAPGLASVAIFVYVIVWNDYLTGAFLTQAQQMATVQVGLARFAETGFGTIWGQFMAYAMLGFVPVLVLFIAVQRYFVAGLTAGATKG